ncbi:MAG: NADH-quinone oxidoreductase subunit L [Rhodobacteraceae bacterium]|nr:MAG: NADH-quinone oxidoreductase subunit L [Paracoccaceae bacterium]
MLLQSITFLPLLGALVAGFLYRFLGEKFVTLFATFLLAISCTLSWVIFFTYPEGTIVKVLLSDWIKSADLEISWMLRFDKLNSVMLVVITTISSVVHLYSIGYMSHDKHWEQSEKYKARFFAYLSLFTFMMLMLVTADNFLQMFFGWEGVGLASYLLIGFYYKKSAANSAAIKAFIVNRVGDFGFALGIFGLFYLFGNINFDQIFMNAKEMAESNYVQLELFAFLLFVGAMGKSAQLFLHTWLPDAMEGPTPVSALIHAATMVTAGVFLVCRISPILELTPITTTVITVVGTATAFFAASVALVQTDIKRIIAYSTCSQLGYMFVAAGIGFYQAAMFHLFTHAFFKALLFLGAGSVIHGMHHEQNIFKMGGLRIKMPYTFLSMLIGTLAITGVGIPFAYDLFNLQIGLAGFASKDAILEGVYASKTSVSIYAFWVLIVAAVMTSFYSWRLIFVTFFGKFSGDVNSYNKIHESPITMLVSLIILVFGSISVGLIFYEQFVGHDAKSFFGQSIYVAKSNHILHDFHYVPAWVKLSPFIAMIIGLVLSTYFYLFNQRLMNAIYNQHKNLHTFLYKKWFFDEFYKVIFVTPAERIGRFFWINFDGGIINKFLNLVSLNFIPKMSKEAGFIQTGFVTHYAFAMIIGLASVTALLIIYVVAY